MNITRQTNVKAALESSPQAPALFAAHGVNPDEQCRGMYDMITLEEAAEWCKLKDLDGLIEALNAALTATPAKR